VAVLGVIGGLRSDNTALAGAKLHAPSSLAQSNAIWQLGPAMAHTSSAWVSRSLLLLECVCVCVRVCVCVCQKREIVQTNPK